MINIRIYLFLLGGTLLLLFLLRMQGRPLTKLSAAPLGIVSLELAKTGQRAGEIIYGWKEKHLTGTAISNVMLDFLFIPFYSLLFYSLCGSISVRLTGTPGKLGILLAFSSLVAGLLDVLENLCMLFSLNAHHSGIVAFLTFLFASLKFVLLGLASVYVLLFGARLLIGKLR